MLKNFENWLLEQNYKSSTAFDYQGRIERLCRKEEATLAYLVENIAEVAANVGKFLKSPIISQKRDILKLILSDCKTKNLCFSIAKPFDELLKTPEINKWCEILCNYRTNFYDEFKLLSRKMNEKYNFV